MSRLHTCHISSKLLLSKEKNYIDLILQNYKQFLVNFKNLRKAKLSLKEKLNNSSRLAFMEF